MQQTDYELLNYSRLEPFIVRIIICCITLRYYLHLQAQTGIAPAAQQDTHRPSGYRLTIGTILAQLIMTFALILLSSIQEALGYPTIQSALHFSHTIDFVYRGIIEITCITAILEELLFRGILEKLLSKITPIRPWITIMSAVAFSLMHCNMSNNLLYFAMGCFLSHLYHQTKQIVYPIMAHGLHNLCATFITYLTLDRRLDLAIGHLTIVTRTMLTIGSFLAVYGCIAYILAGQKIQKYH
ncbi:CPBP family intramembrane glutamic endopeptidase [Cardinium endosymbiont of Nabis limbatus]|uniref:CPBP family intramembrane glutamic endopeptidase n=1 Tax=Cardinium endosymbiont of Nabis limbatus TaxID=3066217 RepID=UPI003AF39C79